MVRRKGRAAPGKGEFRLSLETDPSWQAFAKAFQLATKDFVDWKQPLRDVAKVIAHGHRVAISTRGGSLGEPWAGTGVVYTARKSREGFKTSPLERTGKMKRDLISSKPTRLTKTSVSVGTKVPYARAVHFGFKRKGGRAVVGWTDAMKKGVQKVLQKHIIKIMRKIQARVEGGGL